MSSIDPINSPVSSISSTSPTYTQSVAFNQLSATTQDTLTQSLNVAQLNALYSDTPVLAVPNTTSILRFISVLGQSKLDFQNQLSASDLIDQVIKKQRNVSSALQAVALADLFTNRKAAVATINQTSDNVKTSLNTTLGTISTLTVNQQARINTLNSGNHNQRVQAFIEVFNYNNFISSIKNQLGATQNPDGTFTIPAKADEVSTNAAFQNYQASASMYNGTVNQFNAYRTNRLGEFSTYNASVASYNSGIASANQSINSVINTYNLSAFLAKNNIPNMRQSFLNSVSTSSMIAVSSVPSSLTGPLPTTITIPPPPSWVISSANSVTPVAGVSYTRLTAAQLNTVRAGVYDDLYEKQIVPVDLTINQ